MASPFRADHRPPRAGQGSISGAGRKTGVSWRQATTRQGAGAMGWAGRSEGRKERKGEAAECALGHIVGEGKMRLAPRLLVQNVCNYMKLLD